MASEVFIDIKLSKDEFASECMKALDELTQQIYNRCGIQKEDEMGEETNGDKMDEFGCFGSGYDAQKDGCQGCSDREGCRNCFEIIDSVKGLPVGAEGRFYTGQEMDAFVNRTRERAKRRVVDDNSVTRCDRRGVLELAQKQGRELADYHTALACIEKNMPEVLSSDKDSRDRLGWAVAGLISRVRDSGMTDSDRRTRSLDAGTFLHRSPDMVRRRGGVEVGCDPQDGEDVCADADGWGGRDGPR